MIIILYLIGEPKTITSNRIIPISKSFCKYLKANMNSNEYIIGNEDKPQSPSTYAKNFNIFMKKMSEETGLPELTPHELRHTYGTILRESGVDIYTIQKTMGHSDVSVTADVYIHNDIDVLRRQLKLDENEE